MKRIALTGEDEGKWFDAEAAVKLEEATRWDGSNHISRATGSQWDHEALYYTRSGRWVLNHYSAYQGSLETYSEITLADAVAWLVNNDCLDDDAYSDLPDDVRAAADAQVGRREV